MTKNSVHVYPVDNGDTSLIQLADNTSIIIDCKIRDANDEKVFDVKSDLLTRLPARKTKEITANYTDVFVLTHPDKDHCLGFSKHFYTGNPNDYNKAHAEKNLIIIDEIWVTSMLFTTDQCSDANAIRIEANRRIKMYKNNHPDREKRGNRIRMIGYNGNEKFEDIKSYIPGCIINNFNDILQANFSFFIHAPFKKDLVEGQANKARNQTSIVLQARFSKPNNDDEYIFKMLFGGDADHYIWKEILKQTKIHQNDDALEYNALLSSHHCSWTFFNDVPQENNSIPQQSSLDILNYKLDDGYIIASSKEIKDNDDNPPHYAAKEEYVKVLPSKTRFLNTATHKIGGELEPITFEIDGRDFLKAQESDDEKLTALAGFSVGKVGEKPWKKS